MRTQARSLHVGLARAVRVICKNLAACPSTRQPPGNLLVALLQLKRLHTVASRLLWQCGLSAEAMTGVRAACCWAGQHRACRPTLPPWWWRRGELFACAEALEEGFAKLLPAPAPEAAGAPSSGGPGGAWQLPRQQLDDLLLSVGLGDATCFHDALWAATRTSMLHP